MRHKLIQQGSKLRRHLTLPRPPSQDTNRFIDDTIEIYHFYTCRFKSIPKGHGTMMPHVPGIY
ncbi:MAG: hypothetical protein DRI92_01045 [Aquificota bacterium]|nr:MAG: hypothetical protein DRI92_01045 [Aquificota bacterium]